MEVDVPGNDDQDSTRHLVVTFNLLKISLQSLQSRILVSIIITDAIEICIGNIGQDLPSMRRNRVGRALHDDVPHSRPVDCGCESFEIAEGRSSLRSNLEYERIDAMTTPVPDGKARGGIRTEQMDCLSLCTDTTLKFGHPVVGLRIYAYVRAQITVSDSFRSAIRL